MSKEEKQWLAWIVGTVASFTYLEARAIRSRNHQGTLTYATRKALGIHPSKPHRFFGTSLLVGSTTWLVLHMITGKLVPEFMRTTKMEGVEEAILGVGDSVV